MWEMPYYIMHGKPWKLCPPGIQWLRDQQSAGFMWAGGSGAEGGDHRIFVCPPKNFEFRTKGETNAKLYF